MHAKIILLPLFLLLVQALQAQSGWTRTAGGFYLQTDVSVFSSDDYYTVDGMLFSSDTRFRSQALKIYSEYGWTERLTLLGSFPVLKSNSFNTTDRVTGVGDIRLGAKYGLLKQIPVSIAVEAEIPTGDGTSFAQANEPNALGIRERINLPTTDGEFNVWTTLAASQSTPSGKTYGSLFGSINFRTENFSNQLQAGLEAGQLLFDKLWIIGKLQLQERLSDEPQQGVSFLYGEGTTYTAYSFTAFLNLSDHWKLTATYFDYSDFLIDKRNIYDGATFSLGVAVEY